MRITAKSLRFVRTAVGMEQSELAKASGVSKGLVSAIERGERVLSPEVEKKFRQSIRLNDEMIARLVELHHEVQLSLA